MESRINQRQQKGRSPLSTIRGDLFFSSFAHRNMEVERMHADKHDCQKLPPGPSKEGGMAGRLAFSIPMVLEVLLATVH